jgi:hypothetical protein
MGRGSGWTEVEDECLAKAWLWATGDAIDGTCQDAQSFWLRVSQDFRSSPLTLPPSYSAGHERLCAADKYCDFASAGVFGLR